MVNRWDDATGDVTRRSCTTRHLVVELVEQMEERLKVHFALAGLVTTGRVCNLADNHGKGVSVSVPNSLCCGVPTSQTSGALPSMHLHVERMWKELSHACAQVAFAHLRRVPSRCRE